MSQTLHVTSLSIETLYEQHHQAIYTYVYRMLRNRDDAEDVTQETFLKAMIALPKFDPSRGSVLTWLYIIARHAVYDLNRHKQTRASTSSLEDLPYQLAGPEHEDPQTRYVGSTEQAVQALQHMPAHYREALLLRGAGYTLDELAAHFGFDARTIRGWLSKARQSVSQEAKQEVCA